MQMSDSDKLYNEGHSIGVQGHAISYCPYDRGTFEYTCWLEGWNDGIKLYDHTQKEWNTERSFDA